MIVKDIKFVNNKVEVVLDDKSFLISKENYIENPVTVDSFVDQNKINYLLEQEKIITSKNELIKLLNKKILSEYEIVKKLKDKELKNNDIKNIVSSLNRMGLINDEYYTEIMIDNLLLKRKGKLEIYKCLKEKGIDFKIINNCIDNIDEEIYLTNFNKVYEKYLKMYSNKSYRLKEQMIISKLKEYGYEEELVSSLNIEKDNEEEKDLVKAYLNKLLKSKKINLNNYENINKIKTKLAMKGFNYDIINSVIGEVSNDETY